MKTTYDELPLGATELLIKAEDVSVSPYQNCVPGTFAFNVMALVRRGFWVSKRRHIADDPMGSYTVYGPPVREG